jgi:Ulp1 family protease
MESVSQRNGYDCGMYLLAMAEYLCGTQYPEHIGEELRVGIDVHTSGITPASITQLRTKITTIIRELCAAKERGQDIE